MKSPHTSFTFTNLSAYIQRLNTKRGRVVALFVLLGLVSTVAFSSSAARTSFGRLLFGDSRTAPVKKASSAFANQNASLIEPAIDSSSALNTARKGHSATLLSDGRVLIAGGENADGFVTAAEIYDAATGSFSVTGNLNTPRADHTATRLSDGRVLIAGGRGGTGSLNSTEIFDPASGAFTNGPSLNSARSGQSATVLGDGRILLAGGDGSGSAEILDVAAGTSAAAGSMNEARSAHSAALMQDGRVLIVGGRDASGNASSSGEIFDPANSSFTGAGGMEDARVRPLMRVLFDGKVQIIGGNDHRSLEIYDPAAGIFGGHAHVPPDGDLHPDLLSEIMVSASRAAILNGGETITELPGNQALAAGGTDSNGNATSASTIYGSSPASVTSDALDYPPGTPIIITGRGFQPNEIVDLTFHEDPHVDTNELHTFTVQADANGSFTFDQYAPEQADLGITYILGAKGETSGWTAQTSFHDATNFNTSPTVGAQTPNPVTAGNSATYSIGVTFSGAGSCAVALTAVTGAGQTGLPAGTTATFSPSSVTGTASGTLGSTLTITTTAVTTPNGTYTFTVRATPGAGCGGGSATKDTAASLVVGTANIAPVASAVSISGTAQYGQLLTGNYTYSDADGDLEGASTFRWLRNGSPIGGATATTYTTVAADVGTTLKFEVTPVAATGTSPGTAVASAGTLIGKAPLTVTASSHTVTYGDPVPTVTPSYATFVSPDTAADIDTPPTCTTTYTTTSAAGSSQTTSCSGGLDNTYSFSFVAGTVTVNKADATFTVTPYTCPSTIYNGLEHTAAVSTITGVNGETGATVGTVDVSNTKHTNAGTYASDYWFFTGGANYNNIGNTTISDCIAKADATFTVTPYTCPSTIYNGLEHTAAVSTITGVNGETGATVGTVDVSNTKHTNAGTYASDYWFFTGGANYNDIGNTTITDCIAKADATFTVTPYTCPSTIYNGLEHTAAVSTITGVNGETGATVGTVDVSNTKHTNAGTYASDYWFFTGGANYNNIGNTTITDCIAKADATFTVTPYTCPSTIYNGLEHTAAVSTITGVNGETGATVGTVDVSNTKHTNAGTYASDYWFFTGGANYNDIGNTTITDCIAKADATFTVTPYTCPSTIYNGLEHTAAVSTITGVNGETGATVGTVDVSNTKHTNAGTYASDYWFFTGGANYNNIGNTTISDCIAKANATFTVTPYTCPSTIYNGLEHTAAVSTITGVNGETGATVGTVDVSNTKHTNAGTYASDYWFFTGGANYNDIGNTTISDCIAKADATFTVTPYTCPSTIYNGLEHTAAVSTITGVNGETGATVGTVDVSNTKHTNAGTYASDYWFFTGGANYNDIGNTTITDCIAKADATFTVTPYTCPSTIYNGLEHTAAVSTITGVNGETGATVGTVDVSNTKHTNAGTYASDYWFFTGGANYNNIGNTTITDCIAKADATFTVTPYTCPSTIYNGLEHTAAVSTITGVNGETGATVGTVDVSNTKHTNAGTYASDYWFFTGTANYNNIGNTTITDCIAKADATFTVTPYTCPSTIYNGLEHTAAVSTITGVNGETGATVGTVDVSNTKHTNAGTYASDYWFFTGGANYNNIGNTTISDCIAKANATFTVTPYTCPSTIYNGLEHTAAVSTITGVNGETGATVGTVDVSNTKHTNAGTYASDYWFFTGGANYNNIGNTTISDCIAKANATVTVTPYNVQYDGNPHTATYSITGVNGETGATVGTVDVSNTKHTFVGTYASDYWFFTGGANYNNIGNTTITDVITTAFCFNGFLSPIGGSVETGNGGSFVDPVRAFKLGSTIPVKFVINSWNGTTCGTPVLIGVHTLQAVYYSTAVDGDTPIDATPTDAATSGNVFRLTSPEWHFNLSTKGGFKAGTWLLRATLQDGSVHTVWISIKK